MVSILDLFNDKDIVETNSGFKTTCPCCGLQGGRTQGFILFPDTNTWFCQSSQKHGGILELVAIQGGIIKCMECNGTGEKERIIEGEIYKEVLDLLEERFHDDIFNEFLDLLKIRSKIENPGNGVLISDFPNEWEYEKWYTKQLRTIDSMTRVLQNVLFQLQKKNEKSNI